MATLQELIKSEIGDFFAGFGSPGEPESVEDMQSHLLARIAPLLASMEQEPVYQVLDDGSWTDYSKEQLDSLLESKPTTLFRVAYAAPQLPQPAVVDENGLLPCPFCGGAARVVDNRLGFYVKCSDDDCDAVAIGPRVPELQSDQDEKSIDWKALEQSAKGKWNRRAAMLQGVEPVSQPYTLRDGIAAIRRLGGIDAGKIQAERDSLNEPTCWCRTCRPVNMADMRFVVCPECGNKRCPHANDHRNGCTGSNEPGQEGSTYPAAPQQEVKL
ncbi:Lar family restriction alleviation protein [Citrobacter braakii]